MWKYTTLGKSFLNVTLDSEIQTYGELSIISVFFFSYILLTYGEYILLQVKMIT